MAATGNTLEDSHGFTEQPAVLSRTLTLVVKGLWPVPLAVTDPGLVRAVHRQLEIVGSQSVKMSVMV